MIGFWKVLTSLVVLTNDTNVGVESTGFRSVQLHWRQANFFPTQKDVRTGGSSTSL